jgi:hypothetical protein
LGNEKVRIVRLNARDVQSRCGATWNTSVNGLQCHGNLCRAMIEHWRIGIGRNVTSPFIGYVII